MDIKNICSELLNIAIYEIKDEKNMENIKTHILNPSLDYIIGRFYPYVIATYIIFILIFILCIISLTILLNK